ncbi:MAG: toll/interleukin-1 receptor domain-containing protein [Clostridiales bacterium]|jgi:hypothetical protein|nr:toll/interleukin-1 receptor domain-containing protein [Clostridiales bacterium]
MHSELSYGPVLCIKGEYKGRIGIFDDDACECDICELCTDGIDEDCEMLHNQYAIIYWGNILHCNTFAYVPKGNITNTIPMSACSNRMKSIEYEIWGITEKIMSGEGDEKELMQQKEDLLLELNLTIALMYERHVKTRFGNKKGLKIFISHATKDKPFAESLFVQLAEDGHDPWIDSEICGGQSIPDEISKALDASDYILVILSPNSIESNWVKTEWQSMFWREIGENRIKVIPILLKDCEIPHLLKNKKYIDFREDFEAGMHGLTKAIQQ